MGELTCLICLKNCTAPPFTELIQQTNHFNLRGQSFCPENNKSQWQRGFYPGRIDETLNSVKLL